MTKKQKKLLHKIILSAALFLPSFFIPNPYISFALCLASFVICGSGVVLRAVKNIMGKSFMDEHFLMTVASLGAFGIGEWTEGAAVMLFYQVGELFQSVAVSKSRKSIKDLMDICPERACVLEGDEFVEKDPSEVQVGDILLVKPGERIPVDCRVTEGSSDVDTKAITGESVPVSVTEGSRLTGGCVNINGVLKAVAESTFQNSAVSKILELVEHTSERKTRYESFIHRFALVYTPIVVCAAVALAVLPTLFLGNFTEWLRRALAFLVVSCPCALVISVPLSFFGGLGRASSMGILIKGTNFLDALSKCRAIAFDKTGTLTTGQFSVTEMKPHGITEEELLKLCASAEQYSDHPVAKAVCLAYRGELLPAEQVQELAGKGVSAQVDGACVLAGNKALMNENGIEVLSAESAGTLLYIAKNGVFCGTVTVADSVKDNAKEMILRLKEVGISRTVMLTGDKEEPAKAVAEAVGVSEFYAALLPQDKVSRFETVLSETDGKVIFAGDGINDAPVLAMADVAIAMGALGSDAAIEAADVVLTDDNLFKIPLAVRLAKKTVSIVRQNIVLAIGVKVLVLILSALGFANMWAAVFADVGVAILAILNAMRIMKMKL
ncbi:MAG: cadmium-translocating P-type ATPase [Clostridia bacterium]|nr:cadmium-translocating P-type ATPase [Clostridia bacterium]